MSWGAAAAVSPHEHSTTPVPSPGSMSDHRSSTGRDNATSHTGEPPLPGGLRPPPTHHRCEEGTAHLLVLNQVTLLANVLLGQVNGCKRSGGTSGRPGRDCSLWQCQRHGGTYRSPALWPATWCWSRNRGSGWGEGGAEVQHCGVPWCQARGGPRTPAVPTSSAELYLEAVG